MVFENTVQKRSWNEKGVLTLCAAPPLRGCKNLFAPVPFG